MSISRHDLFIAHAPEPPKWFKPAMTTTRPAPRWQSHDGRRSFGSLAAAERECGEDIRDANFDAAEAWDRVYDEQRLVQWRIRFADLMLVALEPAVPNPGVKP